MASIAAFGLRSSEGRLVRVAFIVQGRQVVDACLISLPGPFWTRALPPLCFREISLDLPPHVRFSRTLGCFVGKAFARPSLKHIHEDYAVALDHSKCLFRGHESVIVLSMHPSHARQSADCLRVSNLKLLAWILINSQQVECIPGEEKMSKIHEAWRK